MKYSETAFSNSYVNYFWSIENINIKHTYKTYRSLDVKKEFKSQFYKATAMSIAIHDKGWD